MRVFLVFVGAVTMAMCGIFWLGVVLADGPKNPSAVAFGKGALVGAGLILAAAVLPIP